MFKKKLEKAGIRNMKEKIKLVFQTIIEKISMKYTLKLFLLMAVLYLFALFGGMMDSGGFTYAEF